MAFAYKIAPIESAARGRQRLRWRNHLAECFVGFEIVCQLALLVPILGSERQLIRASAFGASLVLLVAVGVRGRRHPAGHAAILVLAIVALSALLNPMRNSWMSACAQLVLYVAIMAPLFWVPSLRLDGETWYRVLFIFWVFHSLSAATGVLQVCFPGHFTPNLSSVVLSHGWNYVRDLMITTNTQQKVFRPMGLTDMPGGAANAGLYAVSLGLLLFVCEKRRRFRVVVAVSMTVGLAAIALSQVRTMLVMTAICMTVFFILLQLRNLFVSGRRGYSGKKIVKVNIALAAAAIAGMVILGSTLALSLANRGVSDRVASLFKQDPAEVYYSNRGHFLEETVEDLVPRFPFGAGPGRWGMIFSYFGDPSNFVNPQIWAEIQWTGWVLDGGVPLVLAYVFAISLAFTFSLKTALSRNARDLGVFGAFVFAYNLGAFAQTFDSPFFVSQDGMLFWFMNAMLYAAVLESSRREVRRLRS